MRQEGPWCHSWATSCLPLKAGLLDIRISDISHVNVGVKVLKLKQFENKWGLSQKFTSCFAIRNSVWSSGCKENKISDKCVYLQEGAD